MTEFSMGPWMFEGAIPHEALAALPGRQESGSSCAKTRPAHVEEILATYEVVGADLALESPVWWPC